MGQDEGGLAVFARSYSGHSTVTAAPRPCPLLPQEQASEPGTRWEGAWRLVAESAPLCTRVQGCRKAQNAVDSTAESCLWRAGLSCLVCFFVGECLQDPMTPVGRHGRCVLAPAPCTRGLAPAAHRGITWKAQEEVVVVVLCVCGFQGLRLAQAHGAGGNSVIAAPMLPVLGLDTGVSGACMPHSPWPLRLQCRQQIPVRVQLRPQRVTTVQQGHQPCQETTPESRGVGGKLQL